MKQTNSNNIVTSRTAIQAGSQKCVSTKGAIIDVESPSANILRISGTPVETNKQQKCNFWDRDTELAVKNVTSYYWKRTDRKKVQFSTEKWKKKKRLYYNYYPRIWCFKQNKRNMQMIRLIKQQKLYLRVDFFQNYKITEKKNTIEKKYYYSLFRFLLMPKILPLK